MKAASYSLFVVIPLLLALLLGCERDPDVFEVNYDELQIAPFVEPDFPFITTTIDARELGASFPEDNVAVRCIALQLGNDAYGCFDTDLLRLAAGWKDDFVSMTTMAQISYRDFRNNDNEIPTILGEPIVATGAYPGWSAGEPAFADPREPGPNPDEVGRGPLPDDMARWNGVRVVDGAAVLDYTVAGTQVYEQVGSVRVDGEVGITRTIQTDGPNTGLSLVFGDVSGARAEEGDAGSIYLYDETAADSVTAFGTVGAPEGSSLRVSDDQRVFFQLPEETSSSTFMLVVWRGPAEQISTFEAMLDEPVELADFQARTSQRWTETVSTRGTLAPDTSAFVLDRLTLPLPNPWHRNVRVVDLAFFPDGGAAAVTFEGDVWLIDGIDSGLRYMEWRRFASGLFEPKSIDIVDGEIYVFGREGIVRLNDENGNGEADYYENFSNSMAQSVESREFPNSMVRRPGGGFYISKMAALDFGPSASYPAVIPGMRAGSQHSGSVLEIASDGRSARTVATGLRGPYLGVHPETGMLTASDQEGHYVPATPIYLIEEGSYYGNPATAHREDVGEPALPLTWIPHHVDQSGAGQVWVTGNRMGPLNESLVHLSYGRPGAFRVMVDSTETTVQGGVTRIPADYPAPTMKGVVHPQDGQLYMAGFLVWGTRADVPSALVRLRYTGVDSHLPSALAARQQGVMIRFDSELDAESVEDISSYRAERWNYRRTERYGSGHYRLNDEPGQEMLPIVDAQLSDDRRGIFLAIPDMREVMQMQVSFDIRAASGASIRDAVYFSVHDAPVMDLEAHGFADIEERQIAAIPDAPHAQIEEIVSVARGEEIYREIGCMACHSADGTSSIGPTFQGLYGSERHLVDGRTVTADEDYIQQAILESDATTVEGYPAEMPAYEGVLTQADIASIIEFIRTLE